MKKLVLIFAFALIAAGVYSQKIEAKETSGKFGKENHNGITTTVYYSDVKTVEKELNNLLKDYKGKTSSKKDVIFGDDMIITSISNNAIDAYATVTEGKDGAVEVVIAFDLGGAYLSSSMHPEQFTRAQEIMRQFALSITEKAYADFLKDEEKKLNDIVKDYEKTISTKEGKRKRDRESYKEYRRTSYGCKRSAGSLR
jgi:Skp family chaperone for outer membrane proteins